MCERDVSPHLCCQQHPPPYCSHPPDSNQGLGDGGRGRSRVLSHPLSHLLRCERLKRPHVHASPGPNDFKECARDQKPGRTVIRPGGDITQYAGENDGRGCQKSFDDRFTDFTCAQEALDEATDAWGIKVERVEIKDVKLPQQLQRAMAAEAEATREARAKVGNATNLEAGAAARQRL